MFKEYTDKEVATHKAEIIYKKKWVEFYILNQKGELINLNPTVIHSLPKTLKGRFISNTIGYNPLGWFSEINIKKGDIKFSEKN
jgi:hypothetical protein